MRKIHIAILLVNLLLAPAALSQTDTYTGLEHNGDHTTVRDGKLLVFTYSTGQFNVEYVSDTIFADGFER